VAVVLTDQQLTYLAKTASWKFDVAIKDARNFNDSVVYTGDGVDDLNGLIDRLESMNGVTRFVVSVDVGSLFSNYVLVTLDDIYALRAKYISIFGTVTKPGYPYDVPLIQATKEVEPYVTFGSVVPGFAEQIYPGTNPGLAIPNPPGLQLHEEWQDYGDGRANMAPPRPIDQTPL